ncbi:MAG: hypothetical protein HYZ42_08835, partial [Bacteroidetes bacterium]|nr:hypothetical protein [Bacteroidota bacterium]
MKTKTITTALIFFLSVQLSQACCFIYEKGRIKIVDQNLKVLANAKLLAYSSYKDKFYEQSKRRFEFQENSDTNIYHIYSGYYYRVDSNKKSNNPIIQYKITCEGYYDLSFKFIDFDQR